MDGRTRAAVGFTTLAVVWSVSFNVTSLPFFPTVVVGAAAAGLAGWWVRRALDRPPTFRATGRIPSIAVAVALAHYGIGVGLFDLAARIAPVLVEGAGSVYARTGDVPLVWRLLLGAVITAPLEEVFWRGALQPVVRDRLRRRGRDGDLPVVLVSAGLYAAFHVVTGRPALVAAAALGGVVWGWLQVRTRSVAAPMLAHATWTALMLALPPVTPGG